MTKLILVLLSPLVTLFAGIFTILYAAWVISLCLIGLEKTLDFFLKIWALIINFLARIDVKILGTTNIPQEGCLFVFNHLSLFDIPVIQSVINKRVRFGAKKELFKIPIFGQAMAIAGALKIDRGDRADAIRTLREASRRMREKNESFILAAEGTRQKENKLGDFKSGPFILAIETQCLIVPVVVSGTYKVLPKKNLFFDLTKRHKVYVEFLKPISTHGYNVDQRHEFKDMIRGQMLEAFERLKKLD